MRPSSLLKAQLRVTAVTVRLGRRTIEEGRRCVSGPNFQIADRFRACDGHTQCDEDDDAGGRCRNMMCDGRRDGECGLTPLLSMKNEAYLRLLARNTSKCIRQ